MPCAVAVPGSIPMPAFSLPRGHIMGFSGERKELRFTFMSEASKKKGFDRTRKGGKSEGRRQPRGSGEFRIGSRDILSTPEILSPFGHEEESPRSRRAGSCRRTLDWWKPPSRT